MAFNAGRDGKVMKMSLSLNIVSYELMVYADENYKSRVSSGQPYGHSDSPVKGTGAPIHLGANVTHLVTEDYASDDGISELSFQSDGLGIEDEVELGAGKDDDLHDDQPFLSSTDFLLFGVPRSVLLHVKVSPVTAAFRGHSEGDRQTTVSVGYIVVSGAKNGQILSLGSAEHASVQAAALSPIYEVSFDEKRKSVRRESVSSNSRFCNLPNRALNITVTKFDHVRAMEVDMAKVNVTFELEAAVKIVEFISMSSVRQPKSVLPQSVYDNIRRFMRVHANRTESATKLFQTGLSILCRVHGVEVSVPCSELIEDTSNQMSGEPICSDPSSDERTKLTLRLRLIEYYDGSSLQDTSFSLNDLLDDKSNYSDAKSTFHGSTFCGATFDKSRTAGRKFDLLDIERLMNLHRSLSSHHAVSAAIVPCHPERSLSHTDTSLLPFL